MSKFEFAADLAKMSISVTRQAALRWGTRSRNIASLLKDRLFDRDTMEAIYRMAKKWGRESSLRTWSMRRHRRREMFIFPFVTQNDPRLVSMVEDLVNATVESGLDTEEGSTRLRTETSSFPEPAEFPPPTLPPYEPTAADIAVVAHVKERVMDRAKIMFNYSTTKPDSNGGMPTFVRDVREKGVASARYYEYIRNLHKAKGILGPADLFKQMIKDEAPFLPIAIISSRVQDDKAGKQRKESNILLEECIAQPVNVRNPGWHAARIRPINMVNAALNLPLLPIAVGLHNSMMQLYPNIFKHKGPDHVCYKLNSWIKAKPVSTFEKNCAAKWKRLAVPRLLSCDITAMDHYSRYFVFESFTEAMRRESPIFGYGDYLMDVIQVAGTGVEGAFITTRQPSDLKDKPDPRNGLASGTGPTSPVGKLIGLSSTLAICRKNDPTISVDDLENGHAIGLVNQGDDSAIVVWYDELIPKILGKHEVVGVSCEMEEGFAFLKYIYTFADGKFSVNKDMSTFFVKLIAREASLSYDGGAWHSATNRVKSSTAYFSFLSRQTTYAMCDPGVLESLLDSFEASCQKRFGRSSFELFDGTPYDFEQFADLSLEHGYEKAMLDEDPRWIYKSALVEDLDVGLLEQYYDVRKLEDVKKMCPDLCDWAHSEEYVRSLKDKGPNAWKNVRTAESFKRGFNLIADQAKSAGCSVSTVSRIRANAYRIAESIAS
jgi:hypothetical protein